MKRWVCGWALFSALLMGVFGQNSLPRLAVVAFNINVSNEKTRADMVTVRNLVESQIIATRKYQIITGEEIDKLLANQQIQASAIFSAESIKKLQLQNINYIVSGSVDAMETNYVVIVKILDLSTGQFSYVDNRLMGSSSDGLYTGIISLMSKFTAGTSSEAAILPKAEIASAAGIPPKAEMSSEAETAVPLAPGGSIETYKVGDTGPGGGIIFAAQGNYYMEVSPLSGSYTWSEAIKAAKDHRGGGFSDWYLPSRSELDLIYKNLQKTGVINLGADWYWSLVETSTNYAWEQNFGNGKQSSDGKHYISSVCAIRAF